MTGAGRQSLEESARAIAQACAALWAGGREKTARAAFNAFAQGEPGENAETAASAGLAALIRALGAALGKSARGQEALASLERARDWVVEEIEGIAQAMDALGSSAEQNRRAGANDVAFSNRHRAAREGLAKAVFCLAHGEVPATDARQGPAWASRSAGALSAAMGAWVEENPFRRELLAQALIDGLGMKEGPEAAIFSHCGSFLVHEAANRQESDAQRDALSRILPTLWANSPGAVAALCDEANWLACDGALAVETAISLGQASLARMAVDILERAGEKTKRPLALSAQTLSEVLTSVSRVARLDPEAFWSPAYWGAAVALPAWGSTPGQMAERQQEAAFRNATRVKLSRRAPATRWEALRAAAYSSEAALRRALDFQGRSGLEEETYAEEEPQSAQEASGLFQRQVEDQANWGELRRWWANLSEARGEINALRDADFLLGPNDWAWTCRADFANAGAVMEEALAAGLLDLDFASWPADNAEAAIDGVSLADWIRQGLAAAEAGADWSRLFPKVAQAATFAAPRDLRSLEHFLPEMHALEAAIKSMESFANPAKPWGADPDWETVERVAELGKSALAAIGKTIDPRLPVALDQQDLIGFIRSRLDTPRARAIPLQTRESIFAVAEGVALDWEMREAKESVANTTACAHPDAAEPAPAAAQRRCRAAARRL